MAGRRNKAPICPACEGAGTFKESEIVTICTTCRGAGRLLAYGKQLPVQPDVHTNEARFSEDFVYRYWLLRVWGPLDSISLEPMLAAFVGMNPSSADLNHDDRTVRRCVNFARAWGYDGLLMLNAWALRGTDPVSLDEAADPVGPFNDLWLELFASGGEVPVGGRIGPVIAAWGAKGAYGGRGAAITELVTRYPSLYCLGVTQDGHPRHPLYLRRDTPLEIFAAQEE